MLYPPTFTKKKTLNCIYQYNPKLIESDVRRTHPNLGCLMLLKR